MSGFRTGFRSDALDPASLGRSRWARGAGIVRQTPPMAQQHESGDDDVDYRFLLANERTFLAYLRTALSLQVAGFGILQFLTHGHGVVRYGLGLALLVAGSFLGLSGYLRIRRNEQAMRAGEDLGRSTGPAVVAVVVVTLPLLAAVSLVLIAAL